jgi:hypothetical protein
MNDLTYILPTKIESEDRLKNVITSVSYILTKFPKAKVLVKEVDTRSVFKFRALPEIKKIAPIENLSHVFEENSDNLFHKTRILNDLILMADTKVICSHDVDVVYPVQSHVMAYESIINDNVDVVYPYGCGVWQYQVDYSMETFEKFINSGHDLNVIADKCRTESSTIGWTQFYHRDAVIKGGLWNEEFISWGAEDCEFYYRFNAIGYRVGRIDGPIWHFEHGRSHNSHYNNPKFMENHQLWQRLRNTPKEELVSYYQNVPYLKNRNASL